MAKIAKQGVPIRQKYVPILSPSRACHSVFIHLLHRKECTRVALFHPIRFQATTAFPDSHDSNLLHCLGGMSTYIMLPVHLSLVSCFLFVYPMQLSTSILLLVIGFSVACGTGYALLLNFYSGINNKPDRGLGNWCEWFYSQFSRGIFRCGCGYSGQHLTWTCRSVN